MDYSRMSTADMLQYCNEALAWDEFGPVDIFFFESVKKIILGQCTPFDMPEDDIEDLMGIERPVRDDELEPDYHKFADEYYFEENEDITEAHDVVHDADAFSARVFSEGFFNVGEELANVAEKTEAPKNNISKIETAETETAEIKEEILEETENTEAEEEISEADSKEENIAEAEDTEAEEELSDKEDSTVTAN